MSAQQIAEDYFRLSNEGDLATIRGMFEPKATYSSDAQGLYYGVDDIMAMMTNFFKAYSKRHWTIETIEQKGLHLVEIRFSFEGMTAEGVPQQRTGIERLVIEDQRIRHLEVRS